MRASRTLLTAAPAVAGLSVIGAVVSIWARWPHQFAGQGDRQRMLEDFVSSGTALAPPLPFLVLFVVASLVIRRRDRWATGACVVLILMALLMIVASLGEALAPPTPDVPRAVLLFSGVSGALAGGLLVALGVQSLLGGPSRDRDARGEDAPLR